MFCGSGTAFTCQGQSVRYSRGVDKETIIEILKKVKYPGFSRDIVSFGLVKQVSVEPQLISVALEITTSDTRIPGQIQHAVEEALQSAGVGPTQVTIAVHQPKRPPPAQPGTTTNRLPGVRKCLAVASGKGGVGKSTFSVNLACAFARMLNSKGRQEKVGLLDCDIHGPSIPIMLGLTQRPEVVNDRIVPEKNFGVKAMSMGLLIDESTPVVWRGPMVTNAITQMVHTVHWGDLEILIMDLPPGTGDAQLTLAQTLVLDGAVIVTTPQPVASTVARRGAEMFHKVNVPLLGVVENMSYLVDGSGIRQEIFGRGGGALTAGELHTEFLGQIPLDAAIREGGDQGIPIVVGFPETPAARIIQDMAEKIWRKLNA